MQYLDLKLWHVKILNNVDSGEGPQGDCLDKPAVQQIARS